MANKIESLKAEKDGLTLLHEIDRLASLGWEQIDEDDLNHRLKWLGVFFRKSTPGKFMIRMRIPNGVLTSAQMRLFGTIMENCGADGVADITTRQNIQMRGIRLEDIPQIFKRFGEVGLTSLQSGMDNVRNITGSPVAGIDADELYDTRALAQELQDFLTNKGQGNPEFSNLPRKFNIAIAGCRDNSTHAEINDIAFVPAFQEGHPQSPFGFNVLVGGFFSAKRVAAAIPLNAWVPPEDVIALCEAILIVYREHGLRENRQKSRLMWLIDAWGIAQFRQAVASQWGRPLLPAASKDEIIWEKRDHIGIYPQKQDGLHYVGLHIPVGRLMAADMLAIAQLAETYGTGELRLTVEQNVIVPHIPTAKLGEFQQEPILEKFSLTPPPLWRSLVSCTGNQFCNLAIIETKNRAMDLAQHLEATYDLPRPVRLHWSGCPNSCGQPQVGDIGFIGCKARKDGKVVDGVDIYMGGRVGKDAHLGTCIQEKVPCEDLPQVVGELLVSHFGARQKVSAATATP
jgi:ferredoxin-nitrite reductase